MQSALDQAQVDAAVRLNKITKAALPRAISLHEEWQSAGRSDDMAEAIAEVANLSPQDLQAIRDEGKSILFARKREESSSSIEIPATAPTTSTDSRGSLMNGILAVFAIGLLVVGLVFLADRKAPITGSETDSTETASAPTEKPAGGLSLESQGAGGAGGVDPSAIHYGFQKGDVARYRFDLTVDTRYEMTFQEKELKQRQGYRCRGEAIFTVRADLEEKNVFLMSVQFDNIRMENLSDFGVQNVVPAELKESFNLVQGELSSQTIYFFQSRFGHVKMLIVPEGTSSLTAGVVSNVVLGLSIVFPFSRKNEWEAEEQDTTGRCVARYQILDPEEGQREGELRVLKSIVRYNEVFSPKKGASKAAANSLKVTGSRIEALFDTNRGGLNRVKAEQSVRTSGTGVKLEGVQRFSCDFLRASRNEDVARMPSEQMLRSIEKGFWPLAAGKAHLILKESKASGVDRPPVKIPAARVQELIQEALQIWDDEDQKYTAEEFQLLKNLTEALASNPENIELAMDLWKQDGAARITPLLFTALRDAGTLEAQGALSGVASQNAWPEQLRDAALLNLGTVKNPTKETVEMLQFFSKGRSAALSVTATLGLGIAANRLSSRDEELSKVIVGELCNRLDQQKTPDKSKVDILRALGNARSEHGLKTLKQYAKVEDPNLRRFALRSLGFYPTNKERVKLLGKAASSDPDNRVASTATAALARNKSAETTKTLQGLAKSPHRGVRKHVFKYLSSQMSENATARTTIQAMAKSDPDPGLRRAAQEALKSDSK
ncbi:MAG: HEAT repeat domain-containing protein [Planctomycetota bacterium]|jgi:hypothetical protein|nr:HEAT repeat domain-containing protein [Planctomycetota bacterium]